jgi:hypothetical protein
MCRALTTSIPAAADDSTARLSRWAVRSCESYSIRYRICVVLIQRWTLGDLRCAFANLLTWQRRSFSPRTPGLSRNRSPSPSPSPSDHHTVTLQVLYQKVMELPPGVTVVVGVCIFHRQRHPRLVSRRSQYTIFLQARGGPVIQTKPLTHSARRCSASPKRWTVVVEAMPTEVARRRSSRTGRGARPLTQSYSASTAARVVDCCYSRQALLCVPRQVGTECRVAGAAGACSKAAGAAGGSKSERSWNVRVLRWKARRAPMNCSQPSGQHTARALRSPFPIWLVCDPLAYSAEGPRLLLLLLLLMLPPPPPPPPPLRKKHCGPIVERYLTVAATSLHMIKCRPNPAGAPNGQKMASCSHRSKPVVAVGKPERSAPLATSIHVVARARARGGGAARPSRAGLCYRAIRTGRHAVCIRKA